MLHRKSKVLNRSVYQLNIGFNDVNMDRLKKIGIKDFLRNSHRKTKFIITDVKMIN